MVKLAMKLQISYVLNFFQSELRCQVLWQLFNLYKRTAQHFWELLFAYYTRGR